MLKGKLLTRHPPIELAVAENTLFALPPINRIVPTTKTKMTASITAYSAISWPSSCDQSLRRKSVIVRTSVLLGTILRLTRLNFEVCDSRTSILIFLAWTVPGDAMSAEFSCIVRQMLQSLRYDEPVYAARLTFGQLRQEHLKSGSSGITM